MSARNVRRFSPSLDRLEEIISLTVVPVTNPTQVVGAPVGLVVGSHPFQDPMVTAPDEHPYGEFKGNYGFSSPIRWHL